MHSHELINRAQFYRIQLSLLTSKETSQRPLKIYMRFTCGIGIYEPPISLSAFRTPKEMVLIYFGWSVLRAEIQIFFSSIFTLTHCSHSLCVTPNIYCQMSKFHSFKSTYNDAEMDMHVGIDESPQHETGHVCEGKLTTIN